MTLFPRTRPSRTPLQQTLEIEAAGFGGCATEELPADFEQPAPFDRPLFRTVTSPEDCVHVDLLDGWTKP